VGEVFVYILAIIIAVLVIIYGYNAIKGFMQKQKQIEIIQFKTDIQSAVRTISTEYGSVKKFEHSLPGEAICFTEVGNFKPESCICVKCIGEEEWQYNPQICDAWQTTTDQNVFIIPQIETPILATPLKIDNSYLCIKAIKNKVTLKLEGFGNYAKISEWQ
jgi:hypothetical protein